MTGGVLSQHPWLWMLAWQSTVCLAAGLGGSLVLRRRPARAHQTLFIGLIAAAVIPTLSGFVKQHGWGLLAERPAAAPSAQAEPVATPGTQTTLDSSTTTGHESASIATSHGPDSDLTHRPRDSRPVLWFVFAWILASGVLFIRLISRFIASLCLVRHSSPAQIEAVAAVITTAKSRLGIDRPVVVQSSKHIRSPVIWCWTSRPVLLIPDNASANGDHLDWMGIVCHELAHWKRRDHISGLMAELMVCALPWQILLWWAHRRLVRLSEAACDDWVIACGQSGVDYAETLLDLTPQGRLAFVPSVVSSRRPLAERIHRLLQNGCGSPRPGLRWSIAAVVLAACATLGIAFAQSRPTSPSPQVQNAPAQAEVTAVAQEQTDANDEKILLRLTDPNGQPVREARAAPYVRVREVSVLGSRLEWLPEGISDETGQITLDAKQLFPGPRDKAALYILHEGRGIGAVHRIIRGGSRDGLPVMLKPVCRVHGTLDSTGLAAVGMPLRWAHMYVRSDADTLLDCSIPEQKHDFSLLLPAGTYTFNPYGSGSKGEDSPAISASTEHKVQTVAIPEGQRDLDLGVIDLRPTKVSTLIGHPAPEIGPMKAWKNGPAVTLAQLRGQLVWLHFSGEYPSASRDLPRLVELHDAFGDKGITVIAIYNNASMEELEQRWSEANQQFGGVKEVPFRIAIDAGEPTFYEGTSKERRGATYGRYDIVMYPTDVLIDPAGKVIGQVNVFRAKDIISQMLGIQPEALLPPWRQRFDEVYQLEEGEVLKRIAPPFIPERMDYYKAEHESQAELIPDGPDSVTFHWDGKLKNWGMAFGSGVSRLNHVLSGVLRLKSYEYDGPKELLDIDLPGDWIIRDDAPQEAKLRALESLVERDLGRKIRFQKHSALQNVIVATGRFTFHPPVGTYESTSVHLYAEEADQNEGAGGGTADSIQKFLEMLGDRVGMPVIDRTEQDAQVTIPYRHHRSSSVGRIEDEKERTRQLRILLDRLTAQTELQFEIRQAPIESWSIMAEDRN